MLVYGLVTSTTDEYCCMIESIIVLAMEWFTIAILGDFETTFLCQVTQDYLWRQLDINIARGFLGMFGSINCRH